MLGKNLPASLEKSHVTRTGGAEDIFVCGQNVALIITCDLRFVRNGFTTVGKIIMQIKTRLVAALAFGLFGAFIMWLCAATGWNSWSTTHILPDYVSYIITIVSYGYLGHVYTRSKPAAVRLSVIGGAAVLGGALTWLSITIGLRSWIVDSTPLHAAFAGFVIFALIAAIAPLLQSRSKS
jgi:hypothetical protein